jgi:hypothetical protein
VRLPIGIAAAVVFALWPAVVSAHSERPTHFPDGTGSVPTLRTSGPHLVVCNGGATEFEQRIAGFATELQDLNRRLFAECQEHGYRHLQAAVDDVHAAGITIYVLPGIYQEGPSLAPESDACNHLDAPRAKLGYQILSYEQQRQCPHQQNLVGIFGVKDLQIQGTGASPTDVVFDAQFQKLNVIRGDRTNGVYIRNLTAERSTFNAFYVLETDGFVLDQVVGRWNDEYGALTFASDHGVISNCDMYGNGDSGVYPGGTSDINRYSGYAVKRYAISVFQCRSHANLLGYSGTGGDSVWVHDNEFDHNTAGASMDSLFPNHPGLPQNHALFESNRIHSNNSNYYQYVSDGTCARPHLERGIEKGVVCPAVGVPVGVGVLVIGGNYNVFRENQVYDNWRIGIVQTWVPGAARDDFRWAAQEETSHNNRYLDNRMGTAPSGQRLPNGIDFFWDGQGSGNCWQGAVAGSQPLALPACPAGSFNRILSDPNLLVLFADCSGYDLNTQSLPAGCDWFTTPPRPASMGALVNIQTVAPALQLVIVVPLIALLARRRGRLDALAVGAIAAGAAGAVILVISSVQSFWPLTIAGTLLLGGSWLAGAGLVTNRRLAIAGLLLGLAAILEAVDEGVIQLPLPVGPVWLRIVLELVWIVWTAAALLSAARQPRTSSAGIRALQTAK